PSGGGRFCRRSRRTPIPTSTVIPSGDGFRRSRGICFYKRNARQLAFQVGGVALAVLGMMQHRIDVVEDVPLGDVGVVVMRTELIQRSVGDVLASVGAGFVKHVKREP